MLVMGVDPGVEGALVVLDWDKRRVLAYLDMPLIRMNEQVLVDPVEVSLFLGHWSGKDIVTFVELATTWSGREGEGRHAAKQSAIASRVAKLIGIARGLGTLLVLFEFPWQYVTANSWKGRAGLHNRHKNDSLGVARTQLSWPEGALTLVKHVGRAEAGLIALHGQSPLRMPRRHLTDDQARRLAENVPPGDIFQQQPIADVLEAELAKVQSRGQGALRPRPAR